VLTSVHRIFMRRNKVFGTNISFRLLRNNIEMCSFILSLIVFVKLLNILQYY
jgi:hypothetical protein